MSLRAACSLSRRLTLVLMLALLMVSGMLSAGIWWVSREAMRREQEASAERIARLFEASLHTAMLRRDLGGLAEILSRLGHMQGVASAALLHPDGEIRFASRATDLGTRRPDLVAGLCLRSGCAESPPRIQPLEADDRLRIAYPIRNQARCAACHGPVEVHPVNGVLVVEFKGLVEGDISGQMRGLLPLGLAALGLFALAVGWVVRREVLVPVARLGDVADRVAEGDLSARAGEPGVGELGRLGLRLDSMTERLGRMIEASGRQQAYLQSLLDAAPDPMLVIAEDGCIVLANSAYLRLLGLAAGEAIGQPCHRVSRGLSEPCPTTLVRCPLAELRARPEPLRTVMSLRRRDGSEVSVEIHAAAVHTPDGRRMVVEAIRSLDDQVRFSQEQRLSAVGLLANGVAHEIHNPLASIRLALQSSLRGLRDGTMSGEDVTEYLVLVDKEIDRCVASTQRLLTLSHPPGETRPVDVRAAVEDTLALLEAERQTTGVSVQICLEPPGARVMADEAELRQVILNLVQNAFHAMPRGGQLRVALGREGADYHLSVSDTGVGIGADDQALVFMPFYSRRADGQQGSGLGLAICKAIVERHGGRIGVDSTPGVGSTFHVRLPAADGESA